MKLLKPTICLISLLFLSQLGFAQENENESTETDDLANKIQNPIASLISLPFQNNTDFNTGPDDRTLNTLNIQPVIPISLNENLNLITRTIVPIITQCNATDSFETGLGDVNLSLFLTPAKPSKLAYGSSSSAININMVWFGGSSISLRSLLAAAMFSFSAIQISITL